MRSDDIAAAITILPPESFEQFAVALVRRSLYPGLLPTSDSGDLGEDGKTEETTLQLNNGKWVSLFASKTATHSKLIHDCERCKETKRQIDIVVFSVAKPVNETTVEEWKKEVRSTYGWELEVRSLKSLTELASDDKYASLVDEYLQISPLGGDHTGYIKAAIDTYTKRYLRTSPVLTGMSQTIERDEISKIEEQLNLHQVIAVTGEAGSGKSAVAQSLAHRATARNDLVLFINAQNLASLKTEIDLRSAIGLKGNIAEGLDRYARAFEIACIVFIDQLDSLGEDSASGLLIDLIRDCRKFSVLHVIIFARARESVETKLLKQLIDIGAVKLDCAELSPSKVNECLVEMNVSPVTDDLMLLARNLLNLSLIAEIKTNNPNFDFANIASEMDLWERYADSLKERDGDGVLTQGMTLAIEALKNPDRSFLLPRETNSAQRRLISCSVIEHTDGRQYRFRHERLADYFFACDAADELMLPAQVIKIVDKYRACAVLPWMAEIYKKRGSRKYKSFIQAVLLDDSMPFYAQEALFLRYCHTDNRHDKDATEVIVEMLKKNDGLRAQFLRKIPHYSWAEIFWDAGLLSVSPTIAPDTQSLPTWDAQQYLIEVAKDVPKIVLNHLQVVSGNSGYVSQAIRALRNTDPDIAASGVDIVIEHLQNYAPSHRLSSDITEYFSYLAESSKHQEALKILAQIAAPLPIESQAKNGFSFRTPAFSVTTGNATWYRWYRWDDQTRDTGFRILVSHIPAQVISVIESALIANVKLEADYWGHEIAMNSLAWLEDIELDPEEQQDEYRFTLLYALRDALNKLIEIDTHTAQQKISAYAQHEWTIFRFIGFYFLGKHPQSFKDEVVSNLTNPANLYDDSLFHEFLKLLRDGAKYLFKDQIGTLVDRILLGPDTNQEFTKRGIDRWVQLRLWMLKDHLPDKAQVLLQQLNHIYGVPEYPSQKPSAKAYSVVETGPLSYEELMGLDVKKLLHLIKNWQEPTEHTFGSKVMSRRGLHDDIARLLFENWNKYKPNISSIIQSDDRLMLTILSHFSTTESDYRIDWEVIIPILIEIDKRGIIGEAIDPHTGESGSISFAKGVLRLFGRGFKNDKNLIPEFLLPDVKQMLLCFIGSNKTKSSVNEESRDYYTTAINTVRPMAIKHLIDLAVVAASREQDQSVRVIDGDIVHILIDIFESGANEHPSTYSILGEQYPRLRGLDTLWVDNHAEDIFSTNPDLFEHFLAAWKSFICQWQCHLDLLRLLSKQYEYATTLLISTPKKDSKAFDSTRHSYTQSLVFHALVQYINTDNQDSLKDQELLILRILNSNRQDLREIAAKVTWQFINGRKDKPIELRKYWEKVKKLLTWWIGDCFAQGNPSDRDVEMHSLASAISYTSEIDTFLNMYPLIERVLPHICRDKDERGISGYEEMENYLATQIDKCPSCVMQLYRRMVDKRKVRFWYKGHENIRTILSSAARDPVTRSDACHVLDTYAKRGNHDYRDIFDAYCK